MSLCVSCTYQYRVSERQVWFAWTVGTWLLLSFQRPIWIFPLNKISLSLCFDFEIFRGVRFKHGTGSHTHPYMYFPVFPSSPLSVAKKVHREQNKGSTGGLFSDLKSLIFCQGEVVFTHILAKQSIEDALRSVSFQRTSHFLLHGFLAAYFLGMNNFELFSPTPRAPGAVLTVPGTSCNGSKDADAGKHPDTWSLRFHLAIVKTANNYEACWTGHNKCNQD